MRKIILILFFTFILFLPSASALTLTQPTFQNFQLVQRSSFNYVDIVVAGANPAYGYTLYGTVGCNVTNLTSQTLVGQFFVRNITGNGTYRFNLDERNFPFNSIRYNISFSARAYYKNNNTYFGSNMSVSSIVMLGTADMYPGSYVYHVAMRNHEPSTSTYDKGYQIMQGGTSVDVCSILYFNGQCFAEDTDLHIFITDNAIVDTNHVVGRSLYAHSEQSIGYSAVNSSTLWRTYFFNASYDSITTSNINYENNKQYRLYYGVSDLEMVPYQVQIDTDNSIIPIMFSVKPDTGSITNNSKIVDGIETSMLYFGGCVYFETTTNASLNTRFATGNLGDIVRNYGNSIGMPYFFLFIAFMIIGIFTFIPFSFFIKYNLHPPNFVYMIFISIGVVVNYAVNLFDLWMLIFYIGVFILIIIIRYREDIEKIESLRLTKLYTKAKQKEATAVEGKEYKKSLPLKKDQGIVKKQEWTGIIGESETSKMFFARSENGKRTLMGKQEKE
jgi:hypothetical protein